MANLKDLLVNGPSRFIGDVNITGTPTAPTAATGTNTTQIATTAFIKNTIDSLNLGNARIYYGVCGTAAATAQKEVTCEAYTTTGDPIAGDIIYVAFNVTNSAAVANLTLKVNQSTAKGIRYQKTPQVSTLPSAEYLSASNVYRFIYNGTYWVTVLDTNTDSLLKVYTQTSGYSGDYPILVGSTLASALMGKSNNSTTGVYGIIYKQKAPTVNPATGLLKIPGSLTVGTSGDTNTTLQVYGTTSLSGNLCPSTSGIYDLGSNSLQWKDIYGNLIGNAKTASAVPWSGITNKPTTLLGYGIIDANISNGTITLGSNTITPLTSHQDISGKQDKKPDGTALLIDSSNNKINTAYIPDSLLGALVFGGVITTIGGPSGTVLYLGATLTDSAKSMLGISDNTCALYPSTDSNTSHIHAEDCNNLFFIIGVGSNTTFDGLEFNNGDWLIAVNDTWKKIDNTDSVTSVNGKIGSVVLKTSDLQNDSGYLTSHQSVTNNNINLSRDTETIIATIGSTPIKIKLPASDNTNTATAADNILDGSNSGTQITYAPYTSQQNKLSFDTSSTAPRRTDRLNLNGYLYATKVYSGAKEVITSASELLTTNPFAPNSLKGPYISKIDNAFYAADKRWSVTTNRGNKSILFDGNYDASIEIPAGENTLTVVMDFSQDEAGFFPGYGYPYGNILVSFYDNKVPSAITGKVYYHYWNSTTHEEEQQADLIFNLIPDSTEHATVYKARQSYYKVSKMEFTITSPASERARVVQIEMHLDRPSPTRNPFLSKYGPETLYYDLTAPTFIGNLTGNASSATKLQTARSLQVALDSTSATTFNGTADVNNIPISGTLGIDHGGTGATNFQSNKLIYCNSNNQLTTSFLKINTGLASNAFESSQLVIANTGASMGIEIRKQSNSSGFHSSWQILSDNTSLNQNINVLKLRTNSIGTNNGTYDTDIVDFNYYKVTFYKDIYGTLKGNADTATGANLTTVTNAIAYYSNTTGTFASKSSTDGALYATSVGGELQWGTLPVGQGGTGNNIALTQYRPIFASTTSQMAACTTIYMNNTSLGINEFQLSSSQYNFEVNGKSRFINNIDLAANAQISRAATGTYYWNAGTTTALLYAPFKTGYYNPFMSIGTTDGSWDIGSNTTNTYLNKLLFTYVPSDYSGSSRPEGAITLEPEGNIVANKFKGIADSATEAYIYNGNNRQTGLTNYLAYYTDSNGTFGGSSKYTIVSDGLQLNSDSETIYYRLQNNGKSMSLGLQNDGTISLAGTSTTAFTVNANQTIMQTNIGFKPKTLIPYYNLNSTSASTFSSSSSTVFYGFVNTRNLTNGLYFTIINLTMTTSNNSYKVVWSGILPWVSSGSSFYGYNTELLIQSGAPTNLSGGIGSPGILVYFCPQNTTYGSYIALKSSSATTYTLNKSASSVQLIKMVDL